VGLLVITSLGSLMKPRYLNAFALGIFLWFFVDTIGGSSNLDVNEGFSGGASQAVVMLLFVVGVILLFSADRGLFSLGSEVGTFDLRIPLLVAIAVGIHGFGEGTAFGSTAASTSGTQLLDAFGGVSAGIAYALHKAFEPMMIGAVYVAYSRNQIRGTLSRVKDLILLTILFVVPSLIGAATGYYISYDATYFFALGTGTSVYAAFRLAKPLFQGPDVATPTDSVKIALWLVFGLVCIYLAALFHA
jgi:zinc transporter ZupT